MLNNRQSSSDKHTDARTRNDIIFCISAACVVLILVFAALMYIDFIPIPVIGIAALVIYLALVSVWLGVRNRRLPSAVSGTITELASEKSFTVLASIKCPAIIFDRTGVVLWCNSEMSELLGSDINGYAGRDVSELLPFDPSVGDFEGMAVNISGRTFNISGHKIDPPETYYCIVLYEVTEIERLKKRYDDDRIAVAYISIDNIDDIVEYVHDNFRDAISGVDDTLKRWARSMNGVIKSYDNDKYIMFFDSEHLDTCLGNRFSVLDDVRSARVGDGVPITVSIGVSCFPAPLSEREKYAREALDLALQRGGDQAVYKTESSTEYFGGRTKSVFRKSSVRSRVVNSQLTAMIGRADNVIIMGHRYGDFDSFASAIGVSKIVSMCGVKVNIAVDTHNKNLAYCFDKLSQIRAYDNMFVDDADALDLITPDTLLIVVDVNNFNNLEFPAVARKVGSIAVIDHHRKISTHPEQVKLSYIDPSASSCAELVTEMIETSLRSQNLMKEEAELLLAGILLDTKQFTRNTGTRTFAAAQFLRGAGASPGEAIDLFRTDLSELAREARFNSSVTMYRERIAIASCDGDTDDSYRVTAAKVADKLLTVKGVEAAFALVKINDRIHISGRSSGNINMQLILEKMNGGGHFDVAGAQISSDSVQSVIQQLKDSIDEYLDT